MRKRWLLMIVIFAGMAAGGMAGMKWLKTPELKDELPRERAVKLFRVGATGTAGSTTYPGRVRARHHAKLFFRVSGPVVENNLELGMAVKQGEIIMRIDSRDYEREVERLTHNITVLKSKHTYLEQEFRRMERLLKSNAVSRTAYESALSARDASTAEIKVQETALRIAGDKLADTRLVAPFDGRITDLKIEKFEMAKANEVVVSLQSLDPLEVVVNVPEGNLPELSGLGSSGFRGKRFPVVFPGRNFRHSAVLAEFRPVTSLENGTYELCLVMSQPEKGMVLPGMTVEVLNLPDRREVAAKTSGIPFSAIFKQDGKVFVWKYDTATGKLVRQPVKSGPVCGKLVETDSLTAGTLIVAAGGSWLSEKTQAIVLNPEVLDEVN